MGKAVKTVRRSRQSLQGECALVDVRRGLRRHAWVRDDGRNLPVPIRGRWIVDTGYADLRNMAWFVRNYRLVDTDDSVAVAKLCLAVRRLLEQGEPVEAVVPALVDLFLRP